MREAIKSYSIPYHNEEKSNLNNQQQQTAYVLNNIQGVTSNLQVSNSYYRP